MNNHVLTNFRNHHSLRFDPEQLVFKIDDKVYLISEGVVRQIIPKSVFVTNIGEPYRNLARLVYVFVDEDINTKYDSVIDFAPEDEQALRQLINL